MAVTSPRASAQAFTAPPLYHANDEEHRRQIVDAIHQILVGRLNVTGTVTLTASATTTTITDPRIGRNTLVILVPTTANAATAFATTYQTYPNASNESAVINHASNSQTDRTFAYAVVG